MQVEPQVALPKIMLARYYGANLGRFSNTDPVVRFSSNRPHPQRWNRYVYAVNSPVRYVDPDGRDIYDKTNNPTVAQVGADLTATPLVQSLFGPGSGRDLYLQTGGVDDSVGKTEVLDTGDTEITFDLEKMSEREWQQRYDASSALNLLIRTIGHELGHAILEALGLGLPAGPEDEANADMTAGYVRRQRLSTFEDRLGAWLRENGGLEKLIEWDLYNHELREKKPWQRPSGPPPPTPYSSFP